MAWHPDSNDRSEWIGVGGVIAVIGAGCLTAWHTALVPVCAFGSLCALGLYTALMPLLRLPPWPRDRASTHDRSPGEPEAQRADEPFASTPENTLPEATQQSNQFRDLKFHLREGRRLAGRLDRMEARDVDTDEDHVYDWALATWIDLDHHRPILAKQFFGDNSLYDQKYFATTYGIEVDRIGRRAYLADRLAILSRVVEPSPQATPR
jgi:hypothetical protein